MTKMPIVLLILCWVLLPSWTEAGTLVGKVEMGPAPATEAVIVYIEGGNGTFHPPRKRPEMNHENQQFMPRTLAVLRGTTVDFPNSDKVFHSAFSLSKSNPFDLGIYGPGREKVVRFDNPGLVEIFCHIHEHMYAFIMVLDNPYFTTVKEDGSFLIPDIPEGTYRLRVWTPNAPVLTESVTLRGKETVSKLIRLKMN